jgi:hypothetical protein
VVVNNAGIAEGGAAIDVDIATFDRVIDRRRGDRAPGRRASPCAAPPP